MFAGEGGDAAGERAAPFAVAPARARQTDEVGPFAAACGACACDAKKRDGTPFISNIFEQPSLRF
ncbi:hypothetical protein N9L76_01880 [bacterium]|nr:hypothetical protein [bacterium]